MKTCEGCVRDKYPDLRATLNYCVRCSRAYIPVENMNIKDLYTDCCEFCGKEFDNLAVYILMENKPEAYTICKSCMERLNEVMERGKGELVDDSFKSKGLL